MRCSLHWRFYFSHLFHHSRMRFYLLIIDDPFLEILRLVKDDALMDRIVLVAAWRRSILVFINRNVLRDWHQARSHNFMRVRSEGIQLPSFLICHPSRWSHTGVTNPWPSTILVDSSRDGERSVLCRWVVLLRLRGHDVVIGRIVGYRLVDEPTVGRNAHILGSSGVILLILASNEWHLVVLIHAE